MPDVAVIMPDETFTVPNVLIPVTVRSVKVFGALAIAASIVAVVVASRVTIFCSSLAELMT